VDRASTGWQQRYATAVLASDLTIVTLCVVVGVLLGIGSGNDAADHARMFSGAVAGVLVILGLVVTRAWDERTIGTGTAELQRVSRAFLGSGVVLGLAGLALLIESVRVWVFGVVPLCGVLCVLARYGLRKLLHRRRRELRCMQSVLAVGSHEAVADLIGRTRRDLYFGWHVTGVCTPTGAGPDGTPAVAGVPVVGDLDAVAGVARDGGYRIVAVAPAPGWGPPRLHQLAWELEGTQTELAVDPGLMEIAGPRLHITPVDGMPLLRLSKPRFTGGVRLLKDAFDHIAAAVLLVLLAPVFAVIAIAVRRDGGPAFYVQDRIGANGRTFRMVKFRSMCVDADLEVMTLIGASDGAGPLFKMRADPRVTRVGAVLRRYSLDELPQLFNVLAGSMSLVGPRPPLSREVATYGPDAKRRLLVKPGMTGLWQVSGRSDLSWEETVRLDLRYVENWSVALDASILWKTVGAMARGRGAY
jgi:exopolysaccharide biosynthesis polyprenyl glycosylphosphotransferase